MEELDKKMLLLTFEQWRAMTGTDVDSFLEEDLLESKQKE